MSKYKKLIFVTGTKQDETKIKNFFEEKLRYKVVIYKDCSKEEFEKNLLYTRENMLKKDGYNRFVCFVLSHGDKVN